MYIDKQQKEFEDRLREILNSDRLPPRKFELFAKTNEGVIVGYYWESVYYAFENRGYPGWCYVIEKNGEHHEIGEESLELVEG